MVRNFKKIVGKAPQTPGVYFFKNARGRVLYVGKAINLRARLRSYTRGGWKEDMLREASKVSWQELSSDIEALIHESELIKRLKPQHNIWMRDDKNYFFVTFTKDRFPRIFLTHQPTQEKRAVFIGPFTDGGALKETLGLLRRIFPYCTCSAYTRHKRRCVNAEIGKCLGFCCADIPVSTRVATKYRENIVAIKKVLSGKTKLLERALTKKMAALSEQQRYEEARGIRDQIAGLARIFKHRHFIQRDGASEYERAVAKLTEILDTQKPISRIECFDISHHAGSAPVASMAVFKNGRPAKNEYRKFIIRYVSGINDPAMIQEVISRRLKHTEWPTPDLIIVDGGKPQLNAAHKITKKIFLGAIAKREEELYIAGQKEPYRLKTLPPPLLHLITAIRDEAHRFAIGFHRKRRRKSLIESR